MQMQKGEGDLMPKSREVDTWNGNINAVDDDAGNGILISSRGGGAEACFNKVTMTININIENANSDAISKLDEILTKIKHSLPPNREVEIR